MYKNRYRHILWFFGKIIFSFIWWDIIVFRIGLRGLARSTRPERLRKMAASFRVEAVKMGGVMIKVGQFLSARLDVLPTIITDELAGLQDEVRPEKTQDILAEAEKEFGVDLMEKFDYIDPQVLAAASIGQVHLARLKSCEGLGSGGAETCDVIVKIQRPDIEKIITVDLAALNVVGGWLMRYPPIKRRANIPKLLEEFSRSLFEEVDYLNEGKNAERFAENFSGQMQVQVPKVIWSHTTRRVLTLEYIRAIKITDYSAIDAAGINRKEVAKQLFNTYLKQIFEDRFFHADPHPGNLFVLPVAAQEEVNVGQNWRLVFVDFGMAGSISESLMKDLREILIAVGTQDSKRIIKSYQSLGVLLPGADLDLLEKATNRVFERFWGKTAPELMEMHQEEAVAFVAEFGQLMYDMPFQVPENLILLARCLGILSGMCTGLDYDFNVWVGIAPYAQKLASAEDSGGWRFWLKEIGSIVTVVGGLPRKTDALLNRIEQGKFEVRLPDIDRRLVGIDRGIRGMAAAVIFWAFTLSSTQLYLAHDLVPAAVLGGAALLTLGIALFSR